MTILALVMCGVAPIEIGSTVWEEHPTLRAMIKMVTSVRYRFPTVDCDDMERSEMKKDEQNMREEVSCLSDVHSKTCSGSILTLSPVILSDSVMLIPGITNCGKPVHAPETTTEREKR
mgnify:CR=1 FL=1